LAAPVIVVVVIIVVIPVTHPLVVLTVSHVSPLIPALKLCSYRRRFIRSGARKSTPNHDAIHHDAIQTRIDFANHRVQQRRVPQPPAFTASRINSFSLAKQAKFLSRAFFLRKLLSAISGFRSLCGREQHSSGYCAQWTCVLEPLLGPALASRALVSTPYSSGADVVAGT
jgi:hypothetical protein